MRRSDGRRHAPRRTLQQVWAVVPLPFRLLDRDLARRRRRRNARRSSNGRTADTLMKIAQVAPLYESVPPASYGGTERVVSALCEGLVERGHDVTLFATGDS